MAWREAAAAHARKTSRVSGKKLLVFQVANSLTAGSERAEDLAGGPGLGEWQGCLFPAPGRTRPPGAYGGGRAGGALVGGGFVGRRSGASGRRVDRCCRTPSTR